MRQRNRKMLFTYIKLKFEARSSFNKNVVLKEKVHYINRECYV